MDVSVIICLIAFTPRAFRKLVTSNIISSELDSCDAVNGYISGCHCRCNRRYADLLYNILAGLMNIQPIIRIVDFVLFGNFGSTGGAINVSLPKGRNVREVFVSSQEIFSLFSIKVI